MALKIYSTDYHTKNLELFKRDFYKDHLTKEVDSKTWSKDQGRYTIHQFIRIHLKCKTNYDGAILEELDRAQYHIETYDTQNIFVYREFKEVLIANWRDMKSFSQEVITHNNYLVHNEMRGIRRKFMQWVYWYEIYENNVRIILDDIIKKSNQRRL